MSTNVSAAERSVISSRSSNLSTRKTLQSIAFGLMWVFAALTVAMLLWIIFYVLINGAQVINLEFLTTRPRGGVSGEGGMSTTIPTTLYLVVFTLALAAPLGIGTAIYLVEYAGELQKESAAARTLINVVRTGIEILAGVPSIIFGLFGFTLFVSIMKFGFSLLSGGLAAACLILPVIIRTTEESLMAVPMSYREGSLALGANKWQTVTSVVLPAATPGIVTGIILSVGRIIAETAIFWVTIGGSYRMPENLLSAGRTMSLHVFMLATETRAFDKAMGTSAVLIVTIVILNLVINYFSARFEARFMGNKG